MKKYSDTNTKRKHLLPGILIALAGSFLLFVYAPIQLYVRNADDFVYDIYDLIGMILPVWAAAFVLTAGLLCLACRLNLEAYTVLLGICLTAFTAMYIEGNYLSGFLPELTGSGIDWTACSGHRWYSVAVWTACAVLATVLAVLPGRGRFMSLVSYVGGFGTALLILTLVFSLNSDNMRDKKDFYASTENMFDMSADRNLVIMVLDTIDGKLFSEYLDENPRYRESLEDFTFYDNAMATYPGTKWSVPYVLSGSWFENQTGYYRWKEDAYLESPLFAELVSQGFRMGIYQEELPPAEALLGMFENLEEPENGRISHPGEFRKMQIMLTGLSYLPFDLKRFCVLTPDNIYYDSLKKTGGAEIFTWSNDAFRDSLKENGVYESEDLCFRFYLLQGIHDPYKVDLGTSVAECFELMDEYISALKEAGVYDSSAIVIMGDHGDRPSPLFKQNPALFVKGIEEHHVFEVSDAPVSYADFPDSFLRLLDNAPADAAFDCREGEIRERRFLSPYVIDDNHIVEYSHSGRADDPSLLTETGKVLSPS